MGSKLRHALLLLLTIVLCLSAVTAQATSLEKDGIKVTLATDKSRYEESEPIDVTLTIVNTNDFDVAPVTVQYTIPETCAISARNGSYTEHIEVLKAGETKVVKKTLNVLSDAETNDVPSTGDNSSMFLWLMLAAASAFALSRMGLRNIKRLFALVLCVCLMTSMMPVSSALADEAAINANRGMKSDKVVPPVLTDEIAAADVSEDIPVELNEKSSSDVFEEAKAFSGDKILPFEEDVKRSLAAAKNVEAENSAKKTEPADQAKDDDGSVNGSFNVAKSITVMGSKTDVSVSISYGKRSVGQSAMTYQDLTEAPLWYTSTPYTKEKFSKTIGSGLPQSGHNYKENLDEVYRLNGGNGCFAVTLHFDSNTYFENTYDGLAIYANNEDFIAKYTGSSLADQNVTFGIDGEFTNGVILRLLTDYSVNKYGFKVTSAVAHKLPQIKNCTIVNNSGHVQLTWNKLAGYTGYSIWRAEVDSNGDVIGDYEEIAAYGSSKATSFTDTSTVRGKTYSYMMYQLYNGYDGYYYYGPLPSREVAIEVPGMLPAPENVYIYSASASKVQISWDSVPGATGYAVYSSKNLYSGFKMVKQVTNGDTFATISAPNGGKGLSYYYVCPFVKVGKFYFYGYNSETTPNYALAVPTGVTGKQLTSDSFRVSWKKVTNAQLYGLYYSTDGGYAYYPLYNSDDEWIVTQGTTMDLTGISAFSNDVFFAVTALRMDGDCISESMLSKTARYARPTYRALLIGNTYPGTINELDGPDYDIDAVSKMLARQTGTPYAVTKKLNATESNIRSLVKSTFAGVDDNDISLFYYSGHGAGDYYGKSYIGALCGTDDSYLQVDELRALLDTVPGKKIVLLDSCFSGNHIGKAANGVDIDPDAYNEAVINAFFTPQEKANLRTGNYYVITAAKKTESSYTWPLYSHTHNYGLFTQYLNKSSGFDTHNWVNCGWEGDANNDGAITLGEAYNYIKRNVDAVDRDILSPYGVRQSTQYHGPTSAVLWRR